MLVYISCMYSGHRIKISDKYLKFSHFFFIFVIIELDINNSVLSVYLFCPVPFLCSWLVQIQPRTGHNTKLKAPEINIPYSTFLAPCALNFFRVAANF